MAFLTVGTVCAFPYVRHDTLCLLKLQFSSREARLAPSLCRTRSGSTYRTAKPSTSSTAGAAGPYDRGTVTYNAPKLFTTSGSYGYGQPTGTVNGMSPSRQSVQMPGNSRGQSRAAAIAAATTNMRQSTPSGRDNSHQGHVVCSHYYKERDCCMAICMGLL